MTQKEIYWLACACAPYLQRRFPDEDIMDIAHETFFLMLKAQKNWKGDMPLWKYLVWRARKGIGAYVMRNLKSAHRRSDGSWRILERLTNE